MTKLTIADRPDASSQYHYQAIIRDAKNKILLVSSLFLNVDDAKKFISFLCECRLANVTLATRCEVIDLFTNNVVESYDCDCY